MPFNLWGESVTLERGFLMNTYVVHPSGHVVAIAFGQQNHPLATAHVAANGGVVINANTSWAAKKEGEARLNVRWN